jgi:hypothetical protein
VNIVISEHTNWSTKNNKEETLQATIRTTDLPNMNECHYTTACFPSFRQMYIYKTISLLVIVMCVSVFVCVHVKIYIVYIHISVANAPAWLVVRRQTTEIGGI